MIIEMKYISIINCVHTRDPVGSPPTASPLAPPCAGFLC